MEIYKLEESNWDIFLNIVLNKKIETESDCTPLKIEQQEELAVPIFTSTGNHDVRINGYPLKVSTKIYRNFGLRKKEAKNYQDPFQKHQYKSLMIDKYCLGPYYKHINAFDDYFLKFGNYNFLLLNSGADSFLSLQSLLMADPAGVGFSDKQFNLALNIARREFSEEYGGSLDFIVSHHPVLNPVVKNVIFRKILKFLNLKTWENPEIFKGPQPSNKLHFKFGTISKNWLEMIGLIYQYHAVGLMGHTHRNREIKISLTGKNIEYNKDTKEITNNPFDFIWDDFTEKHRMSYFNQNLPFIFQSPSLGIGRYEDKTSPGRFRYFHLKDNKIWDMKIINLNQD